MTAQLAHQLFQLAFGSVFIGLTISLFLLFVRSYL